MKVIYSPSADLTYSPEYIVQKAHSHGTVIGNGNRNVVKAVAIDGHHFNVKQFKKPNPVNRSVYKFFRDSKAKRSFLYARLLLNKGFDTPAPVGFIECYDATGLNDSYYICEHIHDTFTLHDVLNDPSFPDRDEIIRGYVRLIFRLQQSGIQVIDNSPGNFMFRPDGPKDHFFMVDLNRMNFHSSNNTDWKLKDFRKLPPEKYLFNIISNEYALLSGIPEGDIYKTFIGMARKFRQRAALKRNLKKILKFYKPLKKYLFASPEREIQNYDNSAHC